MRRIRSNTYLKHCYDQLKESNHPLLIYGHALNENADGHILDAIFNTRNQYVIVAIRDDKPHHLLLENIGRIYQEADKRKFDSKQLHFVKSSTVFQP